VAVDDHSSVGFTDLYPDERKDNAVQFLENSVAYYKSLGVKVRGLPTDNGSAFHSKAFAAACERLGLRHKFTRAYRPQTNGNAERFIQSALREWAYGFAYNHSLGAGRHAGAMDPPLQLASASSRNQGSRTDQPAFSLTQQSLDAPHLGAIAHRRRHAYGLIFCMGDNGQAVFAAW
jgi:transposase InsO family protein